jgi:hypothetical protein
LHSKDYREDSGVKINFVRFSPLHVADELLKKWRGAEVSYKTVEIVLVDF